MYRAQGGSLHSDTYSLYMPWQYLPFAYGGIYYEKSGEKSRDG